jgi:hypothetical protein
MSIEPRKLKIGRDWRHRALVVLICAIWSLAGPACRRTALPGHRPAMFEPVEMRINPTFTRFRSFDADLSPDGIEADVELRDEFGDATKGGGSIYFELYQYVPQGADVRGEQIGGPARYDLSTVGAQREYWQNIVRSYRFRLPWRDLDVTERYVLTATYLPPAASRGERIFDRLVILPRREEGQ